MFAFFLCWIPGRLDPHQNDFTCDENGIKASTNQTLIPLLIVIELGRNVKRQKAIARGTRDAGEAARLRLAGASSPRASRPVVSIPHQHTGSTQPAPSYRRHVLFGPAEWKSSPNTNCSSLAPVWVKGVLYCCNVSGIRGWHKITNSPLWTYVVNMLVIFIIILLTLWDRLDFTSIIQPWMNNSPSVKIF